MVTHPIYQIYVELEDYEPKMWRRFQIGSNITLARLGYTIMTIYETRHIYSYEFKQDELQVYLKRHPEYQRHPEDLKDLNKTFNKVRYGMSYKSNVYMFKKDDEYGQLLDAVKTPVTKVLALEGDETMFYYDPEVNWKFHVVLEKVICDKTLFMKDFPRVLDGQGFGIIEQYNGPKELQEIRNKLEKAHWKNIIGYKYYATIKQNNKLNLDRLVPDDLNFRLKTIPRTLQQNYEQGIGPSYRTQMLRARKYRVYRKNKPIY